MSDTPSIPQRTCTKCKQSFPATREFFFACKAGKYGLASWCKTCHREVNKNNTHVWYENNKEHVSEYGKQYRADNAEEIAVYNKGYYWDNVERERQRIRTKYKIRLPLILIYNKKYCLDHVDHIREQRSKRRRERLMNDLNYHIRVRASSKKGKAKRRALMANAEGTHTQADLLQMYEDQGGHCAYCGIGIFWDIPKDIHVEHILPLSRGGSNWPDNLCLTCADCNLSKNDKTPEEWALVRGW